MTKDEILALAKECGILCKQISVEYEQDESLEHRRHVLGSDYAKTQKGGEMSWDWQGAIRDACAPPDIWMANKFIRKLEEHKCKYPTFKIERVAQMFLDASPKVRAWYCYREISEFTRQIHKRASWASFVDSQT